MGKKANSLDRHGEGMSDEGKGEVGTELRKGGLSGIRESGEREEGEGEREILFWESGWG